MKTSINSHSIYTQDPFIYSRYTTNGTFTDNLIVDTNAICRLYVDGWQTDNRRSVLPFGFIKDPVVEKLVAGTNSVICEKFPYIQFLVQSISPSFQESFITIRNFNQGFATYVFGQEPPLVTFSGILLNTYYDNWSEIFLSLYYYFLRASKLAEVSILNNTTFQIIIKYQEKIMKGDLINLQKQSNAANEQGVGFTFQFLLKELNFTWASNAEGIDYPIQDATVNTQDKQSNKIVDSKVIIQTTLNTNDKNNKILNN